MTLEVIKPGVQTTLQAEPRTGHRHLGVPTSGPADALSHVLANRLVGNPLYAPVFEVTLGGLIVVPHKTIVFAVTGANVSLSIDGSLAPLHLAQKARARARIHIGYPDRGCRSYFAVRGEVVADTWLGSRSTYLPAWLGGFEGRALRAGDTLIIEDRPGNALVGRQTPAACRPPMNDSWMLRAVAGPEACQLDDAQRNVLFGSVYRLSNRASRMGGALEGPVIQMDRDGKLPSASVFPGTLQCPPDGNPFLLMADAQTTGGYPRLAQIIRADRHLLGQIKPGDKVRLLQTTPDAAARILKAKTQLLSDWTGPGFCLG